VAVPSKPLQPSDFGLPCDSSKPVLSILSRAFVDNLNAFARIVNEAGILSNQPYRKAHARRVKRMMGRALQYMKNAKELLDWIYPRTSPLSYEDALRVTNRMNAAGFPSDWGSHVIQGIGRKSVGRPGTKRAIAIQAKELKMTDAKRWTWPKIAAALCDCGHTEHTIRCQDNLRREIGHLAAC
jgi:hypothetical protein